MRPPIRCFLLVSIALSACATSEYDPPPSVGTFHGALTVVEQDCVEMLPEDPYVLATSIHVYPRPDLGYSAAYVRLEMGSWTINASNVDVSSDGSFEADAPAPNFVQPENAHLVGHLIDGKIEFEYLQERLEGSIGGGEDLPACTIHWKGSLERQANVFWATMTRGETVCDPEIEAQLPNTRGFLLEVEQSYYSRFHFQSQGWWLDFKSVIIAEDGSFSTDFDHENPYQPEHWTFEGNFDGKELKGTYILDLQASSDPVLGDWPACRIVWNVIAKHP